MSDVESVPLAARAAAILLWLVAAGWAFPAPWLMWWVAVRGRLPVLPYIGEPNGGPFYTPSLTSRSSSCSASRSFWGSCRSWPASCSGMASAQARCSSSPSSRSRPCSGTGSPCRSPRSSRSSGSSSCCLPGPSSPSLAALPFVRLRVGRIGFGTKSTRSGGRSQAGDRTFEGHPCAADPYRVSARAQPPPPMRRGAWIPNSWSGRSTVTRRPSGLAAASRRGSTRWRTGSCATSTSPRTRRSRRCSPSGGTFRSSATRRALTPGRTGSSCAPATPRAAGPGAGRRTSGSCRPTSRSAPEGLSSVVDRDQLERGFRRLSIDHRRWWSCTTTSTCRSTRSPRSLGIPVGTVRSRLHHAMRGLRAALDADARPATREAAR